MADDKPIIIIKKKGGHGGHHGGAWKIAYADFVTAMMAFFMVMWLVNSADTPTRKSISAYFRRPGVFETGSGSPITVGGAGILEEAYVPPRPEVNKYTFGTSQDPRTGKANADGGEQEKLKAAKTEEGDGFVRGVKTSGDTKEGGVDTLIEGKDLATAKALGAKAEISKKKALEKMAEEVKKEISASAELQALLGMVDVKVDADGLNIEIVDTDKTSMFASGSARIQLDAEAAFLKLGSIIAKLPNKVDIVGHTDAKPFSVREGGYSNWELSSDRANAARRLMLEAGVDASRITSVVGRADKELRDKENPLAASNRRITLKMRYTLPTTVEEPKKESLAPPLASLEEKQAEFRKEEAQREEEKAKEEKVHIFTAKEILKQQEKDSKAKVKLPEEQPVQENPAYIQKDKIFGDRPVIGPPDPFSTP